MTSGRHSEQATRQGELDKASPASLLQAQSELGRERSCMRWLLLVCRLSRLGKGLRSIQRKTTRQGRAALASCEREKGEIAAAAILARLLTLASDDDLMPAGAAGSPSTTSRLAYSMHQS